MAKYSKDAEGNEKYEKTRKMSIENCSINSFVEQDRSRTADDGMIAIHRSEENSRVNWKNCCACKPHGHGLCK